MPEPIFQLRVLTQMSRRFLAVASGFVTVLGACSFDDVAVPVDSISIADLFEAEVGYSLGDVNAAALDAWSSSIRSCVLAAGFEPIPGTIADSSIRAEAPPRLGSLVASQQVLVFGQAASNDASPIPRGYSGALNRCMDEVAPIIDPTIEVATWLQLQDRDLAARVLADGQVRAAAVDLRGCLRAAGIPADDENEVNEFFLRRLETVGERLRSGEIDVDAARGEIRQLERLEASVAEAGGVCLSSYRSVYEEVYRSEQGKFLAANLEAVTEKLRELRDDHLDAIRSFLADA